MNVVIDIIASFIAGIMSMPFIVEGITYVGKWQIRRSYIRQIEEADQKFAAKIRNLRKSWNEAVQEYNKKLSKMEKRLKYHGLFIESDNNHQIIVKKVPVKMPFIKWLKQKRW